MCECLWKKWIPLRILGSCSCLILKRQDSKHTLLQLLKIHSALIQTLEWLWRICSMLVASPKSKNVSNVFYLITRKYLLCGYILGVPRHTTAWDRHCVILIHMHFQYLLWNYKENVAFWCLLLPVLVYYKLLPCCGGAFCT